MAHLNLPGISAELAATIISILMEVERAEKKHPIWPDDVIRQIAFVSEESGELTRAGNLLEEGEGSWDDIRTEAIHTAATAVRLLTKLRSTEANHVRHVYIEPIDFEISEDDADRIRREVENG